MADTAERRYEMKTSSHRGNSGSSSTKNAHRSSVVSVASMIESIKNDDKAVEIDKPLENVSNTENMSNVENISNIENIDSVSDKEQIEEPEAPKPTQKPTQKPKQRPHHRGRANKNDKNKQSSSKNNDQNNKPVNLLPEFENVRNFGVGRDDATPQELYAIGAVFDHIYRGGSPMNCIRVFQKEVNRAPAKSKLFCATGYGNENDDEDTFVDWRSKDDDTLDERTYDRSFVSREESYQSLDVERERARAIRFANARTKDQVDQPWDEGTAAARIGMSEAKKKTFRNHRSSDASIDTDIMSEMSGITTHTTKKKKKSHRRNVSKSSLNSELEDDDHEFEFDSQDETMERLKTWSNILVTAAKENGPKVKATAERATSSAAKMATAAANAAKNRMKKKKEEEPSSTTCSTYNELNCLVHMFRTTMDDETPEEPKDSSPLQTTLVKTFQTNVGSFVRTYEGDDTTVDDVYSSDESFDAPLNHLAKAMQKIANKEPTRTHGVSEQDRVAKKQQKAANTSKPPIPSSKPPILETLPQITPPKPPDSQTQSIQLHLPSSTASLSGISEGIGSHRGDASPVGTSSKDKIPTSIRVPPTSESPPVLQQQHQHQQDLFLSPKQVTSIPHKRSFFRRREGETVSKTAPSPRRHLPPVAPTRVTPSPPTRVSTPPPLYMSSDNDGTELCIIGVPLEEGASVVTPPRSTAAAIAASSPKSGISIKQVFSFRKRRSGVAKANNNTKEHDGINSSPRSTMRVDTQAFESADDDLAGDESVIACIADDSMVVVTPLMEENDTSSTNGLLLTQTNEVASMGYEVQSV